MKPTQAQAERSVHFRSIRLARRLVDIISAVLRPEEIHEAVREFYLVIREELDANDDTAQGRRE